MKDQNKTIEELRRENEELKAELQKTVEQRDILYKEINYKEEKFGNVPHRDIDDAVGYLKYAQTKRAEIAEKNKDQPKEQNQDKNLMERLKDKVTGKQQQQEVQKQQTKAKEKADHGKGR